MRFDLLFRWFVGLSADEPAWDHSSFSKNRDRLLDGEIAARFLSVVLARPRVKRLLSTRRFQRRRHVDRSLGEPQNVQAKDDTPATDDGGDAPPSGSSGDASGAEGGNADVDFKGTKHSNATHRSTTDPEALLYRKGPGMEAKLCFIGHGLMENRSGLIVDARLTFRVLGHAERLAALEMIAPYARIGRTQSRWALTRGMTRPTSSRSCRSMNRKCARKTRLSAIDGRTTRHASYATSQRVRKRIEEAFGWIKTIAGAEEIALRRPRQDRLGPHLRRRRLQSGAAAQAVGGARLMARKKLAALAAPFLGRWRIAEMDLWDNEALDLVEPAFLEIKGQQGEMRFIAVQAWLDFRYDVRAGGPLAEFSWEGIDEGDQRLRPWLGCDRNRRTPRRPPLLPHGRQLGLRLRAVVSSSTAC